MNTLVFLLTLLVLVGALVAAPVTLFQKRSSLARRIGLGMLAWLGVYVALLLGFAWLTPQEYLNLKQEKCFDEMCFSVTQATRVATPQGTTVTIMLQLRNAALRSAQKPDSPVAVLVDGQGHAYQLSAMSQHPVWAQQLQPGETQDRALIFQIPATVTTVFLEITEGSFPSQVIIGSENSPWHEHPRFRLFP
jgi:hypothetical protein